MYISINIVLCFHDRVCWPDMRLRCGAVAQFSALGQGEKLLFHLGMHSDGLM